jgi:hypothetical protein
MCCWTAVLDFPGGVGEYHRRSEGIFYGDVAQLEEHLLCKQGVVGSSPIISTTTAKPLLSRGANGPSLG